MAQATRIYEERKVPVGWRMICEFCAQPFNAKRRHARFCSATCRGMHSYREQKKKRKT